MAAFDNLHQLVESVLHLGFAQSNDEPVQHSLVDGSSRPFLLLPFHGPLEDHQDEDDGLAAEVGRVDKDGFVLFLHCAYRLFF